MAVSRLRSFFSPTTTSSTTVDVDTIDEEQVENLFRLLTTTTTRTNDLRKIVSILKVVSKESKLNIGEEKMISLGNVLLSNKNDPEIIQSLLQILINCLKSNLPNEEQIDFSNDSKIHLTEFFIEKTEYVNAVFDLIQKSHIGIRGTTVELMKIIAENCPEKISNMIIPNGRQAFVKLLKMLHGQNEIILNHVLEFFQIIIRSNVALQELFVVEGGFDYLFQILVNKHDDDQDLNIKHYLSLILQLLKNNALNQRCFYERFYLKDLIHLMKIDSFNEPYWSAEKIINMNILLKIIRALTSSSNSPDNVISFQRNSKKFALLRYLYVMLKLINIPADTLADVIHTIADLVDSHPENQQFLNSGINQHGIIQPSLLYNLLNCMINGGNESFRLRMSILYLFKCYLKDNESAKSMIIDTFFHQTHNVINEYTLGDLLIKGYTGVDSIGCWCCGITLSYLTNTPKSKQAMLEMVGSINQSRVYGKTLMEISFDILKDPSSSFHAHVAVLILMATWLSNCGSAVEKLLSIPDTLSYFISQLCTQSIEDESQILIQSLCSFVIGLCLLHNNNKTPFTSESIEQLIIERIGVDIFQEKLQMLLKSKYFVGMKQEPRSIPETPNEIILDNEFTILYMYFHGSIIERLRRSTMNSANNSFTVPTSTNPYEQQISRIIKHYDDLIRERD
jgi:hypothetical protein